MNPQNLLEAYGIVTKNNIPIDTLNPKICFNCSEGNIQDAKFCSKCKMIMNYEGYQEALESEKKKEGELNAVKEQLNTIHLRMQDFAKNAVMDTINQMLRNGQIALPSLIHIGGGSSNGRNSSSNKPDEEEMMSTMPRVIAAGKEQYTKFSTERLKSSRRRKHYSIK
jgi:hypothetical protein